jgi:nucleotide-binding universal stress UspA family protein
LPFICAAMGSAWVQRFFSAANAPLPMRFSGFAKDGNADLIVAGAYGRSRLGEWMFGGVTHKLLAKSQLCCLFSHGNGREV